MEEFRRFALTSKTAVIAVSETWLDRSLQDAEIELMCYSIYLHNHSKNGGGVCHSIRTDISYNLRADLQVEGLQASWVELLHPKSKPIIIGVFYRPPRQSNLNTYCRNIEGYKDEREKCKLDDI